MLLRAEPYGILELHFFSGGGRAYISTSPYDSCPKGSGTGDLSNSLHASPSLGFPDATLLLFQCRGWSLARVEKASTPPSCLHYGCSPASIRRLFHLILKKYCSKKYHWGKEIYKGCLRNTSMFTCNLFLLWGHFFYGAGELEIFRVYTHTHTRFIFNKRHRVRS